MALTKEAFLETVKNHRLEIIKDEGLYRHIVMSDGTFNRKYCITTWPWGLCFSGDMGCFVFSRLEDNFSFFRRDQLAINEGYWHEKLMAIDRAGGSRKYSPKLFEEAIKGYYDDHFEFSTDTHKEAVWQQIQEDVISRSDDGHDCAITAAAQFKSGDDFEFVDFYPDCMEYTYHYLWCLYAIVHTISEYDKATA